MTAALMAEGLHTYYGKSHILHGVGLEVAEGKITALLGRNGAGKTTTLRSLMGLTAPRQGRVTIFGVETTHWPTFRIAALGVGYVPEGRRIFANLSVEENLKVPLEREGPWAVERIYKLFPRLEERKQNRGRQLSGGEQEMLSIARAAAQPTPVYLRRAVARAGASDRARGVPHRRADEGRGNLRSAGRTECSDEPGNRRRRLCAE